MNIQALFYPWEIRGPRHHATCDSPTSTCLSAHVSHKNIPKTSKRNNGCIHVTCTMAQNRIVPILPLATQCIRLLLPMLWIDSQDARHFSFTRLDLADPTTLSGGTCGKHQLQWTLEAVWRRDVPWGHIRGEFKPEARRNRILEKKTLQIEPSVFQEGDWGTRIIMFSTRVSFLMSFESIDIWDLRSCKVKTLRRTNPWSTWSQPLLLQGPKSI